MKWVYCRPSSLAVMALSGVAGLGIAFNTSAATLTVTPNSVSNLYSGLITLQIGGLTNGEPVVLNRYLDVNTNGVVDPGEPIVQSTGLSDGQVLSIGGVRDINVPGDEDGNTNGQIQTLFSLSKAPELSRLVGPHLFTVSSPIGNFPVVTQSLTVTQSAFAQRVTGQVTSSSLPVPYAGVALLMQEGDDVEFVSGVLADATGSFSLNCAPGGYMILAVSSNHVFDFETAPFVNVGAGQVVTQGVTLTAATRFISGTVRDAATSNGIPAIQFFVDSDTNKVAIVFTDANGNFSIPAVEDLWKIDPSEASLAQRGYLSLQNQSKINTVTNSVTNLTILFTRETALVWGYVKDGSNAPLPGIEVFANDGGNLYRSAGIADVNGYYVLGARNGSWSVNPDNNQTNYLFQGTNLTVVDGQAYRADFVASSVSAHLRGTVRDNNGDPIPNISLVVQPYPSTNGTGSIYPSTDGNGEFDVPISAGDWNIALECTDAQERNFVNRYDYIYTVVDGVDQNGLNLVFPQGTATISGTLTDTLGNPVPNVTLDAGSSVYYAGCVMTDSSGNFQINVLNGTWLVEVRNGDLNSRGYMNVNNVNVVVSGTNQTANFVTQPFPPLVSQPKIVSGQFRFTLSGYDSRSYRIEASTNLNSWINLGTNQTVNGTYLFIDPSAASSFTRRFYRTSVAN
jgi:hypothetical protein